MNRCGESQEATTSIWHHFANPGLFKSISGRFLTNLIGLSQEAAMRVWWEESPCTGRSGRAGSRALGSCSCSRGCKSGKIQGTERKERGVKEGREETGGLWERHTQSWQRGDAENKEEMGRNFLKCKQIGRGQKKSRRSETKGRKM